jgi:hypothetical protein
VGTFYRHPIIEEFMRRAWLSESKKTSKAGVHLMAQYLSDEAHGMIPHVTIALVLASVSTGLLKYPLY